MNLDLIVLLEEQGSPAIALKKMQGVELTKVSDVCVAVLCKFVASFRFGPSGSLIVRRLENT